MKKLLLTLLILVLTVSVLTIPAQADGTNAAQMVITVEPAEAHPGETVLVTYSVESAAPLTMLDGQISLPEESLEIQSYTEDFKSYGFPPLAMDGDTVNGYNPSAKQLTLAIGQATSNNWTVMTFTCKVKDNAALGSITVGFNNPEVDDGASLTVKPTTIKVVHAGEHTFVDDTDNAQNKAATCTEDGVMYQKCSIDGCDATTTRSVPATGHSYDNGVETKPATCQQTGVKTYTCTKCQDGTDGHTKTEQLEKLPHKWAETAQWSWGEPPYNSVTATLTCQGNECEPHTTQPVSAEVEMKQTDATCTEAGKTVYTATVTFSEEGTENPYTDEKTVNGVPLGHTWKEENIDWGAWSSADPEKPFDVTLKCSACDAELTAAGVKASKDASSTEPTCENAGSYVYTATVSFDKSQDEVEQSKDKVPQNVKHTFDPVAKDALGHDWADDLGVEVNWTWDGEAGASKRVIELDKGTEMVAVCKHDNCDGDGTLTISYDKKEGSTDPTCTTEGKVTYVATGVTKDGKGKYTFEDEEQTLNALGHDYGENKPVVEWPELENENAELKAEQIGDVTLVCNRDGCTDSPVKGRIKSLNIVSKVDATYLNDGKHIYTVTAVFPDGKNGEVERTSEEKTYTIPKLEAKVDASASGANVGEGAQTALQNAADALVEAALGGTKPAGMPDAVFQAIQKANISNQSLKVTTELVTSPADVPSDVPGGVSAINASIKITINNTDIEEYVSGEITDVPDAISLKFPKPATGGPIFYVMTDHGNDWSKIDSKADGEYIVFSTKQFSQFVLVGSNDLANASITVDSQYAYTGAVIRPVVKVTINGGNAELKEGTDYEVAVDGDPIKPGEYKVTIKGINNYTGSVTKTFTILEPETTTAPTTTAPTATAAPTATPAGAPATGDETPVALYAAMLTVCAAALTLVLVFRRKRQK